MRAGVKIKFVFTTALTLTLSLGERGQPALRFVFSTIHLTSPPAGFSKDAGGVSPSPKGEGRDEGELSFEIEFSFTTALTLTLSLGERGQPALRFVFSIIHLTNPAAGISLTAGSVSPSPRGRRPG
jgi:hypothetical protein